MTPLTFASGNFAAEVELPDPNDPEPNEPEPEPDAPQDAGSDEPESEK